MELEQKPSIWKYYTTPAMKKLIQSLDNITDITTKYIEEAIVRMEKVPDKSDYEKSVVEKLVEIDKKIAMVMATDMLAAGVDTVCAEKYWIVFLLCFLLRYKYDNPYIC